MGYAGKEHEGVSRRAWLAAAGSTIVAGSLAATAQTVGAARWSETPLSPVESLATAFRNLTAALSSGDLDSFYGFMHPRFLMVDEDSPWRLDLPGFKDHIRFHISGVWESFAWVPRDVKVRAVGATGVVAGNATFRGKPRDAGFRLRHLLFSQGWIREADGWRMLLWHQAPVVGLTNEGSPE